MRASLSLYCSSIEVTTTTKLNMGLQPLTVNWIYSVAIIFDLLAYGIGTNLVGPALLDLQFISQTSSEGISYLATYLALGYMLGSLVALLMRWLNRQITIGFALSLQAITLAVMPHCKQLSWLSIVCVTYGFGGGAFDSSLTVWLIEMWPKSSESFLQAAHLTFGLGMIIGPLVCAPFVYGEQSVITLANGTNVTITNKMREDLLTIPFSLSSAIQFLIPLFMFISFVIVPYRKTLQTNAKGDDGAGELGGPGDGRLRSASKVSISYRGESFSGKIAEPSELRVVSYRYLKLFLVTVSLAPFGAQEATMWSFLPATLQYGVLRMSAESAATVLSIAAGTFALGKIVGIFLTLRLAPETILTGHHFISNVAIAMLYFFRDNDTMVRISVGLMGFGFSVIWPSTFSLTERYVGLTNPICSLFSFMVGLNTLLVPIVIGPLLESNPNVFFYAMFGCEIISSLAFIVIMFFFKCVP